MSRKVGRVTPCAPQFTSDDPDGEHGVTRPTITLASARPKPSGPLPHSHALRPGNGRAPAFPATRSR